MASVARRLRRPRCLSSVLEGCSTSPLQRRLLCLFVQLLQACELRAREFRVGELHGADFLLGDRRVFELNAC